MISKNSIYFICYAIISLASYLLAFLFKDALISIAPYYVQFWHILTASFSQLQDYFPRYYSLVFIVSGILKYFFPVLFIYLLIKKRTLVKKNINKAKFELDHNWWKTPLFIFISGLFVSLALYYISFNKNFIHQVVLAKLFLLIQVLFLGIFAILNYKFLLKKLQTFLQDPILPYNISLTRILFFSYLGYLYLTLYQGKAILVENLEKMPLPGIGWLIDVIPVNSMYYEWMCYAGAITAFFIVIGFKTRFFLFLNIFIVFYVVATPNFFGKLWHEQLVIWIAWIMAYSSSYDVLSIDSWLDKKKINRKGVYGFHLKIIWLHFGIIYFFAGFFKLWISGFDWALSSSMVNQVQLEWFEHYNKIPNIRIDKWPALLMFGGLSAIVFELFYLAFLFNKKTRGISAIGGLVMHNVIGYFMYISFSHLLQAFYLVFIPWNFIIEKLKLIKKPIETVQDNRFFKKWAILIPIGILAINIIYGIFRINSYPFSIYPVYAAIVPETFKYFEYNILDKGYENIDIHLLGKENYFRWESYSRFEPEIIKIYEETGVLDTAKIIQQWHRWQNGVDTLKNIDSLEVYSIETYIAPEKQKDTISKYKLLDILSE